ncbi:hypothetical protein PJK47_30770, partial [Mycobacterium kansasii]
GLPISNRVNILTISAVFNNPNNNIIKNTAFLNHIFFNFCRVETTTIAGVFLNLDTASVCVFDLWVCWGWADAPEDTSCTLSP